MNAIVLLRWSPGIRAAQARAGAIKQQLLAQPGWQEILNRRGAILLLQSAANDVCPILLPDDFGLVLGPIFRANDYRRLTTVSYEITADWCASDGESLTRSYWGGYLAILCDRERDRVLVVRDPMGARPCFLSLPDETGLHIVFTRFEDVAGLAPIGEIDVDFLSSFLIYPRLVTVKTGFKRAREILGGECVALNRVGVEAWTAWSPPVAAPRDASFFDADAKRLGEIVRASGRAWADLGLPILHRLSGGLDSSIVLAALQDAEAGQVRTVIEFPVNCPEGDERAAARAVATRFGVALAEIEYRAERIDYQRLLGAPLQVKPSVADLSFADEAFAEAMGGRDRLRLLSSGQGGDQVFHKADPMPAVADAFRDRLTLNDVVAAALDVSRIARRSVYPPLLTGLLHSGPWPNLYVRRMLRRRLGAHRWAPLAIEETLAHPWFARGQCERSGQALRALLLADVGSYHDANVLSEHAVLAPILTSQPIVEFCFGLPLYHMQRGGVDRALARAAFADMLPASSVARLEKGDTTRFHAEVARRNNDFLRDALSGGELMRAGLIEGAEIEAMLATAPAAKVSPLNVSAHIAAELWLRKIRARALAASECASASSDADPASVGAGQDRWDQLLPPLAAKSRSTPGFFAGLRRGLQSVSAR